jgi:two-component system sensor histidine kinase RegB
MLAMPSDFESSAPGLQWLIRLRWLALAGQCVLFLAGAVFLGIDLPLSIVLPALAVTTVSNLFVTSKFKKFPQTQSCAALLVLDTLTLTVLLYWLGGAHNPFTAFYLLHITIAAVLLPVAWTWIGVALCAGCYGLLFWSPHEIKSASGISCCESFDSHLQGMLLAMVLVGICIAYFVGQLKSALTKREAELVEARMQALRNEKFAGLATLAAGVAHELATPLSTIAVLSADLEDQANSPHQSDGFIADARLIRQEVERCRSILEKLGANTTDRIGENPQSLPLGEIAGRLRGFLSPSNYQRLIVENVTPEANLFVPVSTLLQSLAVLIKNACEADEIGRPVRLRIGVENDILKAAVQDEGVGMAEEVAARAGEPFFTTKPPGQGMGLGLFLARMFAERMKGRLTIRSVPNKGSTVCLEFPATR